MNLLNKVAYYPEKKFLSQVCFDYRQYSSGLQVIKVPAYYKQELKKLKGKKKPEEGEIEPNKGNKNHPIILCKRKEFNHYKGQIYKALDQTILATKGWGHKKSVGDHFTICPHGQHPAFTENEDNAQSFEELGLDVRLCEQFKNIGITSPTNIQSAAIPHILEGSNVLVAAETGNGKTYSFLAPIIHKILQEKYQIINDKNPVPLNMPKALVVLPSRELVEQTKEMCCNLSDALGVHTVGITGGRMKRVLLRAQMQYTDILVASFGAISKLFTNRMYNRDSVSTIVLDEVDSLLDDSFSEGITHFLSKFPIQGYPTSDSTSLTDNLTGAQLVLTGATFPTALDDIISPIVEPDSIVSVHTPHLHRILPHITQTFYRLQTSSKPEKLLQIVKANCKQRRPLVIFSNTTSTCIWLHHFLQGNDIICMALHGNLKAEERKGRFAAFQNGEVDVMVCTDIASRGLDTVRATQILNYEFPRHMSNYIHRCGRTGRVGAKDRCAVVNFVCRGKEVETVQKIEYSARKSQDLPDVDANITNIIQQNIDKKRKEILELNV